MSSGIVTLLTDFGDRDVYVGGMKGVIAQVNPALTVVDLTHHIPPQDLMAARFNLMNAFPYFPTGTVHIAVVDPGVGSQRRAIAIELPDGILVGPDNGIFSGILEQHPAIAAVELDNPLYWRSSTPSSTFHGRDIFAPVGAHLASGCGLSVVGSAIDPRSLVHIPLAVCQQTAAGFAGSIQYIDHFGNLVSNIPGSLIHQRPWFVLVGTTRIAGQQTYADVAPGNLLALVGSHGWVEIAVANGSAQNQLQIHQLQNQGDIPVEIVFK